MSVTLGTERQKMGQKHEKFLAKLFGGRMSRGSGNQWREPADGRHNHHDPYAFAWDGKSTLNNSIAITRKMWAKIVEQAAGERPMLAIRFYDTRDLDVGHDLVMLRAEDLSEMREELLELQEKLEKAIAHNDETCEIRADAQRLQEENIRLAKKSGSYSEGR